MSDLLKGLAQLRQVRQAEDQAQADVQNAPGIPAKSASHAVMRPMDEAPAHPLAETLPADEPSGDARRTAGPGEGHVSRGEEKTLAGRVPLSLHRELSMLVLETADELGFRRIYIDEALEAAVRLIARDPEVRARWTAEVQQVRREKAGS